MVQMLFWWQSQENVSKDFLQNMPMSYIQAVVTHPKEQGLHSP